MSDTNEVRVGGIWFCKIGEHSPLQRGADSPMRDAVAAEYKKLTGQEPAFIFSGWSGELTEPERAVVENRLPVREAAPPADAALATVEARYRDLLNRLGCNGHDGAIAEINLLRRHLDVPADEALADVLRLIDEQFGHAADVGATYIAFTQEETKRIAAALRAREVPEGKKYHDVAQRLYALLDDIDTAGDIAKSDDKLYRGIVERTQAKKRDFVVSCDGYTVTLADDSMLTASKEAP